MEAGRKDEKRRTGGRDGGREDEWGARAKEEGWVKYKGGGKGGCKGGREGRKKRQRGREREHNYTWA